RLRLDRCGETRPAAADHQNIAFHVGHPFPPFSGSLVAAGLFRPKNVTGRRRDYRFAGVSNNIRAECQHVSNFTRFSLF
ncbi:MAG: hypothetical protein RIM80_06205, partial [Alphaproteobacteria bacterium]